MIGYLIILNKDVAIEIMCWLSCKCKIFIEKFPCDINIHLKGNLGKCFCAIHCKQLEKYNYYVAVTTI